MEKEKFIVNFFRIITLLTPLLMLLKSMLEKNFKNVVVEVIVILIYLMLIILLAGYLTGSSRNEKLRNEGKNENDTG
jgi:glycerol uptake facilitator-like aquaporin